MMISKYLSRNFLTFLILPIFHLFFPPPNTDCTDKAILDDCLSYFMESFPSISSSACFLFHELAVNPDIQSKLFNEIRSTTKHLNNTSLPFETLSQLKYLDMVVSEAFRRWCPIPQLQQTCIKPINLTQSNGSTVQLAVGDNVLIPSYAIQMDSDYFVNPEKFDPERFNETRKDAMASNTYLPFGVESCKFEISSEMAAKFFFCG